MLVAIYLAFVLSSVGAIYKHAAPTELPEDIEWFTLLLLKYRPDGLVNINWD